MDTKMYRKEKLILTSLITNIIIYVGYSLYVYIKYIKGNVEIINDFTFWGKAFLILIPIMIVAQIVIHIIFAIINKIITNEDIPMITDERDKLIDLKAIRFSHVIFGLGFLLAMGSQAIGMPPWVMFITLIASSCLGTTVSEITKMVLYNKGF